MISECLTNHYYGLTNVRPLEKIIILTECILWVQNNPCVIGTCYNNSYHVLGTQTTVVIPTMCLEHAITSIPCARNVLGQLVMCLPPSLLVYYAVMRFISVL